MIDFSDIPELEPELSQVNEHIERMCQSNNANMQEMLNWILAARGKQIRPILTLLCAKLKEKKTDATEIAAVVEICHTSSLIHDDIIDDADLRRGRLSVQKKFGREMAVYAGDFMIFSATSRTSLTNKPWYREMFKKLESMCDGEVNQFWNRYNTSISEEQYLANISMKTSSMFEIACCSGAYEGKCNQNERQSVEQFAKNFGLLFQLRDDLMDFISSCNEIKKSIHSDFWCGYYTLPAIHTFRHPEFGQKLKDIALNLRDGMYEDRTNGEITRLIEDAGGYQYTLDAARRYATEAAESLSIFCDSAAKRKLTELLWDVLHGAEELL